MSRWHRPHIWLVKKKFAGMTSPVVVVADDGTTVAKANEEGEEETIFANYADLKKI